MTLAVHGATLIDGTGSDPLPDAALTLDAGRVRSVGAAKATAGERLDLDGMWLLPGLIDLHTHMGIVEVESSGRMPPAVLAGHLFRNAELCLQSGHTTAREVAGADGGLRQAIDAGLVPGPRLLPSGPLLCQSGGHGDYSSPWAPLLDHHHGRHSEGVPGLAQFAQVCDGPEQVRIAARRAFQRGATQIKVCVSGGVVSLTDRIEDTQFTVEELSAAVEEARARDTYVTAHAHNVQSILNGLEAGLECFEHGTFLDEATAAKLAAAGASLVPTLSVVELMTTKWREWGIPSEVVPRLHGVRDAMEASIKIAYEHGVRVGSGTDLVGPTQANRGLEIVLKARVVGAMEAIVSATRRSAEIIRMADDLGTVTPGKRADLIALDFDPLSEPELFANPDRVVLVIKDGRIVKDIR